MLIENVENIKDNIKISNIDEESKFLLNVDEFVKGKDVYCF